MLPFTDLRERNRFEGYRDEKYIEHVECEIPVWHSSGDVLQEIGDTGLISGEGYKLTFHFKNIYTHTHIQWVKCKV